MKLRIATYNIHRAIGVDRRFRPDRIAEILEVEIIAFNAGLHMLREDTSPIAERLENFAASMPNVSFVACGNTIDTMSRIEGGEPPIFEFSGYVVAGVARLMELDQMGYTIVKP